MRKAKKFEQLKKSVDLIIHTKAPTKWFLIDRETGEVYQGSPEGHWDRLDPVIRSK